MEYSITTHDNRWIVALNGSFTFTDNQKFRDIISEVKKERLNSVELDMSNVEFIDSAALGMLLLLKDETAAHNTSVILKSPSGQVKKMLELSKFETLFTIN
jgi:anti-anti-sigma factor